MPDKEKYIQEMTRVLKPGGRIVVATWCQREEPPEFNERERKTLDYLYGEWTHPYFISIEEYAPWDLTLAPWGPPSSPALYCHVAGTSV